MSGALELEEDREILIPYQINIVRIHRQPGKEPWRGVYPYYFGARYPLQAAAKAVSKYLSLYGEQSSLPFEVLLNRADEGEKYVAFNLQGTEMRVEVNW